MKHFLMAMILLAATTAQAQNNSDAIFYSSLNYAIQLGQMDGVASLKQVKQHGDFGVGSQHQLAGEMVLLNDTAYKISIDGKAVIMPADATLPFAAAKFFKAEQTIRLTGPFTLEQLQTKLDSLLNTNRFAALKITGNFDSVNYKCYIPQQKPYPTIKQTPTKYFDSTNTSGSIVGFFTPKSAMVLNSPNYHFHFINAYRTSGGHVDACKIRDIIIDIDYANELIVQLPNEAALKNVNLNEKIKE